MAGTRDADAHNTAVGGPVDDDITVHNDWEKRLAALADELTAAGKLRAPLWQHTFRSVPRHVFVPRFFEQDDSLEWHPVSTSSPAGMAAVYSNRALFTDVDCDRGGVSSSSMPGLMTRMLELLDVSPGQTVLEIGTGTGYNAALLCAALGDDHVFSVDIDYVDTARKRLASLGYAPTLRTKDGLEGLPQYGPFDRIMSTVAVHRVPWSWVEQLAQDGAILTDLKLAAQAGNLVRLMRSGDCAEGRFDNGYAAFMSMRHPDKPEPTTVPRAHDPLCEGITRLTPKVWEQTVPWFIAALELPVRLTSLGFQMGGDGNPVAEMLAAEDGSSATADLTPGADGARRTVQMGPTRLWDAVERGYRVWEEADRPGWERLGLTVTTDRQWVWLDKPDDSLCWDIPVRDVPAAELPT